MSELVYISEVLLKLAVAVVLGGTIGWEREAHDRPAGLRTHVLVCVGSAVYMILSISFTENADPSRIAAQVATGMGFLGAGTIIRHGSGVRGLTTAASLWAVAAIGLCVGRGERGLIIAIASTAFVFVTLRGLTWVEKTLVTKEHTRQLILRMRRPREYMTAIHEQLSRQKAKLKSCTIADPDNQKIHEVRMEMIVPGRFDTDRFTLALSDNEDIASIEWD